MSDIFKSKIESAIKSIGGSVVRKKIAPGYYPDLSNDDYHNSYGYSSTSLKVLSEKTKFHMDFERDNPSLEEKDCMVKGRLLHSMVMEPDITSTEFALRPEGLKKPTSATIKAKSRTKSSQENYDKWLEWKKDLGQRTEVTNAQLEVCANMTRSIRNHPILGNWFDGSIEGMAEQSVFYKKEDMLLKVRSDWILKGHPVLFDIKSTKDASFTEFMKQAKKLGYDISAAMYLDGCNSNQELLDAAKVERFEKFVWVVVENTAPFCSTYYELSKEDLEIGAAIYRNLVNKLVRYKKSDWTGYGEINEQGQVTPDGRVSILPKYGKKIV